MQRGKDTIWNPRLSLAAQGTLGNSLSLEPWSPLLALLPHGIIARIREDLSANMLYIVKMLPRWAVGQTANNLHFSVEGYVCVCVCVGVGWRLGTEWVPSTG